MEPVYRTSKAACEMRVIPRFLPFAAFCGASIVNQIACGCGATVEAPEVAAFLGRGKVARGRALGLKLLRAILNQRSILPAALTSNAQSSGSCLPVQRAAIQSTRSTSI